MEGTKTLSYGLRHAPIRQDLKDALLYGSHKPISPVEALALDSIV